MAEQQYDEPLAWDDPSLADLRKKPIYTPKPPEPEPVKEQGFFGNLADVAKSGMQSTITGERLVGDVTTGAFDPNAAGLIQEELTRKRPEPEALKEAKADIGAAADDFSASVGFVDSAVSGVGLGAAIVGEAFTNPAGLAYFTAEQAGNMAPAMAGGYAGSKVGAATGAGIGSVVPGVGTVAGGAIGTVVGGLLGAFAGGMSTEVGAEFIGRFGAKMQEAGIEPTEENINRLLADKEFTDPVRMEAMRKGAVTAAVDAPLTLLGGRIATAPARAARKAAVKTLGKGVAPNVLAAAAKENLKAYSKLKRAGYMAAGAAFEGVSEGVSEAAGQLAATGKVDVKEVAFEMFGGLGGSTVTLPVSIATYSTDKVRTAAQERTHKKQAAGAVETISGLGDFKPVAQDNGMVQFTVPDPAKPGETVTLSMPPKDAEAAAKMRAGIGLNKEEQARIDKLQMSDIEALAFYEGVLANENTTPETASEVQKIVDSLTSRVEATTSDADIAADQVQEAVAPIDQEIAAREADVAARRSEFQEGRGSAIEFQQAEAELAALKDQQAAAPVPVEAPVEVPEGVDPVTGEVIGEGPVQFTAEDIGNEIQFVQEEIDNLNAELRSGQGGSAAVIRKDIRQAEAQLAALQEQRDALQPEAPVPSRVSVLNVATNAQIAANPELTFEASEVPTPEKLVTFVQWVKDTLGKDVVFFSSKGTYAIDGMVNPRLAPNSIFIDIKNTNGVVATIGHELVHLMRYDDPALYAELATEAFAALDQKTFATEKDRLEKAWKKEGIEFSPEALTDAANEEAIAEVMAKMFMDQKFWDYLGNENPTLLRQLLDKILELIGAVTDTMPADVAKLRKAAADTLTKYASLVEQEGEVGTIEGGTSLSRKKGPTEFDKVVVRAKMGEALTLAEQEVSNAAYDKWLEEELYKESEAAEQRAGAEEVRGRADREVQTTEPGSHPAFDHPDYGPIATWIGEAYLSNVSKLTSDQIKAGTLTALRRLVKEGVFQDAAVATVLSKLPIERIGQEYIAWKGTSKFSQKIPAEAASKGDKSREGKISKNMKDLKNLLFGKKGPSDAVLTGLPFVLSTMPLAEKAALFKGKIKSLPEIAQLAREVAGITDGMLSTAQEKVLSAVATFGNSTEAKELFMEIMNTASRYQVRVHDLGKKNGWEKTRKEWTDEQWTNAGMEKITGFATPREAYNHVIAMYDSPTMTPKMKKAYRDVRNHIDLTRKRSREGVLRLIQMMEKTAPGAAATLRKEFNATFNDLKGEYSPLGRFGDIRITVYDENGEVAWHQKTDSMVRADMIEASLREMFPESAISRDVQDSAPITKAGLPTQVKQSIEKAAEAQFAPREGASPEEIKEAEANIEAFKEILFDQWIKSAPEGSYLKNSARRKGTLGFEEDALRSYVAYTAKASTQIAYAEKGRQIDTLIQAEKEKLSEMKKADKGADVTLRRTVLNDVESHIASARNRKVGELSQLLGKMTATWYLSSPTQFMQQISQVGIITFPKIASKYGGAKAASVLSKALGKAMTPRAYSPGRIHALDRMFLKLTETYSEDDYNAAIKANEDPPTIGDQKHSDAEKQGMIDNILIQPETQGMPAEMQAALNSRSEAARKKYLQDLLALRFAEARNILDISLSHQAINYAGGERPGGLTENAMFFIRESELISRKATVLAAMEAGMDDGMNFMDAFNYADYVNIDTLYDYSVSGKPSLLGQSDIVSTAMTFQTFRLSTLWKLIRLGTLSLRKPAYYADLSPAEKTQIDTEQEEARKEFTGIMANLVLVSGVKGLPIFGTVMTLVSMAAGDEDEPVFAENELRRLIEAQTNKEIADAVTYGLPSVFGWSMSTKLGMDQIFSPGVLDTPEWVEGAEKANYMAASLLGPAWGLVTNAFRSAALQEKGQSMRALEASSPKIIKDGLKALRFATEGVKTGSGDRLLADGSLTSSDILMMLAGTEPFELFEAREQRGVLKAASAAASKRKAELIREYGEATEAEDVELMHEIVDEMREFVRKNPQVRIQSSDLRSANMRLRKKDIGYQSPANMALIKKYGLDAVLRPEYQQ